VPDRPSRAARVQAYYDALAPDYDESRYASDAQRRVDAEAQQAVLDLVDRPLAGARVLDCGCGTGRFARLFADQGARVTGIDASPRMLDIARQRVPEADFRIGDVRALELEERFDVVVCSQVLTHLGEYEAPLRSMLGVTAPGGSVTVDIRNRHSPRHALFRARRRARALAGRVDDYDPHFTTLGELTRAGRAAGLEVRGWRGVGGRWPSERLSPTLVVELRPACAA
jgi:ubiquinone/menaquinone biosynthesis C-methylase UbiE